jgi:hypothetical protein
LVAVKNDPVHSLSGVTVALEVALNFSPLSFDLTPLSFAASRAVAHRYPSLPPTRLMR